MVTREAINSVSEDEGESNIVNENGKRVLDASKDGKKRVKTKSLYRQPTVNELNRLQETENLFNSNLFRLQVEEVLQEVKLREKTEKKIKIWFESFRTYLIEIPEDETVYDLSEPTLFQKIKIKIPLTKDLAKTKCSFKFHRFNDIEIVGSYSLGTAINSKLIVDVQITVPADTYTKNDSINYRYHKKRAAYLAIIASWLLKLENVDNLSFSWLNGCETRPVIDLTTSSLASHMTVRIHLGCESEAYKLHRFSPSRNNLRESWLLSSEVAEKASEAGPPTPYYNNSILQDLNASLNNKFLNEVVGRGDNLKNAIVLLKIWLRQRNLQVSGFVTSMLVAYLVQNRRINNIMSSYQIVRNVWIYLKTSEWNTKGISLYKGADSPSMEEFHQHCPVVFLDTTGYHNICWQMTPGTYQALKRECTLAVEMLDNSKINSFIPLFMTKMEPLTQFDHILCFKNLPKLKSAIASSSPLPSRLNFGLDQLALTTHTLHQLLTRGLGDRAHLILQLTEADFTWPVKKTAEKVKKDCYTEKLSLGFILNPETCMNIVEKGPPANLPEAEEFRSFWGDKSDLRRFQDGSITEACVWEGVSVADRRTITRQIIDYLLTLKYDIDPVEVFHVSEQLESLTVRKQYCREGGAGRQAVGAEGGAGDVTRAFDQLRTELRGLTQLPLDVSAVYGRSSVFSHTEPLPALAGGAVHTHTHTQGDRSRRRGAARLLRGTQAAQSRRLALPEYCPVATAVIELGHSGKWPGEIEAFRCLKAAFHLQISERLHQQYSLTTQAYPTHVDVVKQGLVFRLEIAHPKEITLLRRELVNGVVKFRETPESEELLMKTVTLPRLRGALHGLHQRYPAYGPTTVMLKRWLCCHLLSSPHVPDPAPELLSAAVFLLSCPLAPPHCPTIGFFRVMRLLAETDWKTEVLMLDFNDDMTQEDRNSVEQQLLTASPRPALCIVTSQDGSAPSPCPGTRAVSVPVLSRLQALASTTYSYMREQLLNKYNDNILGAFVPSLSDYDVLVYLHPSLVPYYKERVTSRPELKPLSDPTHDSIVPVVEFNVVEKYLHELRSAFSELALFFHDACGGDVITVLWTPSLLTHRELQIGNSNALKPTAKGSDVYKVNVEAVIQDFRIMGEGLVRDIVVNNT